MKGQIQLRRLSKADFEGLLRAHYELAELIGTLKTTNWAAAGACIVLAGHVDSFVCGLYNKAEASLKARLGLPIADPPGQAEAAAPAEPADDQGGKGPD